MYDNASQTQALENTRQLIKKQSPSRNSKGANINLMTSINHVPSTHCLLSQLSTGSRTAALIGARRQKTSKSTDLWWVEPIRRRRWQLEWWPEQQQGRSSRGRCRAAG